MAPVFANFQLREPHFDHDAHQMYAGQATCLNTDQQGPASSRRRSVKLNTVRNGMGTRRAGLY